MEIEAKVPITIEEFEEIKKLIPTSPIHKHKQDIYYSKYDSQEERKLHNEPLVRVRDEGETKFFTIKRKSKENGFEINEEKESEISNNRADAITTLLQFENYKPYFSKKKETYLWCTKFKDIDINCELVVVNDKFRYFEVETANYEGEEKAAIEAIKDCFEYYGLNYEKADERAWAEIIKEDNDD